MQPRPRPCPRQVSGRTKGFWAAKVLSVSAKAGSLIWRRKFNVKKAIRELRSAADEVRPPRSAWCPSEPGRGVCEHARRVGRFWAACGVAAPLAPLLVQQPAHVHPPLLAGVWALRTSGVS